jgi:hypothetical protein
MQPSMAVVHTPVDTAVAGRMPRALPGRANFWLRHRRKWMQTLALSMGLLM